MDRFVVEFTGLNRNRKNIYPCELTVGRRVGLDVGLAVGSTVSSGLVGR